MVNQDITRAMSTIAQNITDNASYDKTRVGFVKAYDVTTNTYTVTIDQITYSNVPILSGHYCDIGDVVKVVYPCDNSNSMFILDGKLYGDLGAVQAITVVPTVSRNLTQGIYTAITSANRIIYDQVYSQVGTELKLVNGGIQIGANIDFVVVSANLGVGSGLVVGDTIDCGIMVNNTSVGLGGWFLTPASTPATSLTCSETIVPVTEGDMIYFWAVNRIAGRGSVSLANWINRLTIYNLATSVEIKIDAGGGSGDKTFIYTQSTPSTTWTVTHNLNKYPSISVVNSTGTLIQGSYSYINVNTVALSFSTAVSGKAYLN